ncbi:MAG: sugar phosphate isomerase/epimerase [Candidatus Accumulibacter sp.]|jgi:sugar phosphate isomerase/epimerase|nr:sugar phosphate isomerase/epimerase [Accumulibacter sp.]
MSRYRYFLAIQTVLPDDYRNDADFIAKLRTLQELGFDGVGLNMKNPDAVRPDDLKQFLGDFGLTLSAFATGLTTKTENLSLSTAIEARRKTSVRRARDFLAFAAEFGAATVAGYLKGAAGENAPENLECLKASIAEIAPEAERLNASFVVEAINRFESPLGHSLDETWDIIREAKNPCLHLLPDTWHMNIEEANMEAAIVRHRGRFISLDLSDNNRLLPGLGALDFKKIIGILDAIGYQGKLSLEGNLKTSFTADVTRSMAHLAPLLAKDL